MTKSNMDPEDAGMWTGFAGSEWLPLFGKKTKEFSMNERLTASLDSLFARHRIVFWYDARREMGQEFASLELPGVVKAEIDQNEFGLKYRILKEEPERKFLLYHAGPQPAPEDNWLLDLLLAHGELRLDQESLWLEELGLDAQYAPLMREHAEFLRSGKRLKDLAGLLEPGDGEEQIRLKMLAALSSANASMGDILERHFADLAAHRDESFKLLERCGLAPFFWERMAVLYKYAPASPSLEDFALELFASLWKGEGSLSVEAQVFMENWKEKRRNAEAFKSLSSRFAQDLNISVELERRDYKSLLHLDCFRAIDSKIIASLARQLLEEGISAAEMAEIVRQRSRLFWSTDFEQTYAALLDAARLVELARQTSLEMESLSGACESYCASWHKIDQLYRHFCNAARKAGDAPFFEELCQRMDKLYVNGFLHPLQNSFQGFLPDEWRVSGLSRADSFFPKYISPVLARGNKLCVIISDALRYEAGAELREMVEGEDRFSAELEAMLSLLPSATPLGMAALLPHGSLEIDPRHPQNVLVDGLPGIGLENRDKILGQRLKARALRAEEVLSAGRESLREWIRENDICYIYHDRIDASGDSAKTESDTFKAVEESLADLLRLIKKLAGNNVNNMLVTADHGFLFQRMQLDEADFISLERQAEDALIKHRYILGRNLGGAPGLKHYTAAQLGLKGEMELLIPRGLGRIRTGGGGSRYVHGGASLQEIILPVLRINKKRRDDSDVVSVEILGDARTVSTNQLTATFWQKEAVTPKMKARRLRAGVYSAEGELLSSRQELIFDSVSDSAREREMTVSFNLASRASKAQRLFLRLEERARETNHFSLYKEREYIFRNYFESDFDL